MRREKQSMRRRKKEKMGPKLSSSPILFWIYGSCFFLGLMVAPTTNFSLVMAYIVAHNSFFHCNGLHWHPQFCFDPPNNLHPKPKSLSYPYLGMDLISASNIIFSKENYIYILYDQISLLSYLEIRISLQISKLISTILISKGFQK
jgi:hypothetical protein